MSSSSSPALEVTGLTKRYGSTLAVDQLTLSIPRGTVFGMLGPNGAGKSTTLKMLLGLLAPTAGTIQVLGLDLAHDAVEIKQRVGYVPEAHFIYRWMRVQEVIGFCRALYRKWNDATCQELLRLFQLDPAKKVKHLSKGMLVKLSLLLAVCHEPELLILDEPMSGLDPLAREEFLDGVLRTICERGQTVLFSSHTLDDVQRLASVVGILYAGRLIVHGRLDELLTSTKRVQATLRNGQRPAARPEGTILERLQGRQWLVTIRDFAPQKLAELRSLEGVEHVEVQNLGLEELFKDIVKGQRSQEEMALS